MLDLFAVCLAAAPNKQAEEEEEDNDGQRNDEREIGFDPLKDCADHVGIAADIAIAKAAIAARRAIAEIAAQKAAGRVEGANAGKTAGPEKERRESERSELKNKRVTLV